jgi:hypothetical protein
VYRLAEQIDAYEDHRTGAHLASQAMVVAINFLGRNDYRATPFIVAGHCGAKDANKFVDLIKLIVTAYENSGALKAFGWPFSISTDGDSARQKGGFALLSSLELNCTSPLGKLLYPLVGMNLMVGPHDILLDFDWKHIIKREQ